MFGLIQKLAKKADVISKKRYRGTKFTNLFFVQRPATRRISSTSPTQTPHISSYLNSSINITTTLNAHAKQKTWGVNRIRFTVILLRPWAHSIEIILNFIDLSIVFLDSRLSLSTHHHIMQHATEKWRDLMNRFIKILAPFFESCRKNPWKISGEPPHNIWWTTQGDLWIVILKNFRRLSKGSLKLLWTSPEP